MQSYLAPSWLKGGGHVETIFPKFISAPALAFRRELLPDSTGQAQVAYDFVDTPQEDTPLVVLFHGLEGNSSSHYAQALMAHVKQKQWLGVVVHYRGCGGVVNLSDKAYHSGDSLECAWVLKTLANRHPKRARFAMGVSLGGNVLAKYLGESREAALLDAAAVVSAPLDLVSASTALEHGLSRTLYAPYFLRTLLPKVKQEQALKPLPELDWQKLFASRSLKDFDDYYTAPVHGFASAHDYDQRSSAKPLLKHIARPTLIINAQNDPFMPAKALPTAADVSRHVRLYQPRHGGHVGFVSGRFPGHLNWLPQTVLTFFSEQT